MNSIIYDVILFAGLRLSVQEGGQENAEDESKYRLWQV